MTKDNTKENFDDRVVEIEDTETNVGRSKKGKTVIVVISILFAAALIRFFIWPLVFEKKDKTPSDQIVVEEKGQANIISDKEVRGDAFTSPITANNQDFTESFTVPSVPELPELPELSNEVTQNIAKTEQERQKQEEEFQKRLDEEKQKQDEANKALEQKIKDLENKLASSATGTTQQTQQQEPIIKPRSSSTPQDRISSIPEAKNPLQVDRESEATSAARQKVLAQRKATAILTKTGSGGPTSSFVDGGGIILTQENTVKALEQSVTEVTAQRVKDLKTTILQGKLIYAVLETAINTDFEGTLRAIVNRDVYAEQGNNILISKGSRLIGTYQAGISRGQSRLLITWNRIIRTDGVEIAINSGVTDQFGRTGLQGEVDNKYVEVLGNSLLTSILTIATAVASEKVTNSTGITTTSSTETGSSAQSSGKPSDYAIIDATKDFMDTAKDLVKDVAANAKPTMRIPQGTKLLVFVNQDLSIPPIEE